MLPTEQLQYQTIAGLLSEMAAKGEFTTAVITDQNGLLIASSDGDMEACESQSAAIAQLQGFVQRAVDHLNMDAPEEVSFNDTSGRKMVCRSFPVDQAVMYLAVIVPSKFKSHRKLMNQAIRAVQKLWKL